MNELVKQLRKCSRNDQKFMEENMIERLMLLEQLNNALSLLQSDEELQQLLMGECLQTLSDQLLLEGEECQLLAMRCLCHLLESAGWAIAHQLCHLQVSFPSSAGTAAATSTTANLNDGQEGIVAKRSVVEVISDVQLQRLDYVDLVEQAVVLLGKIGVAEWRNGPTAMGGGGGNNSALFLSRKFNQQMIRGGAYRVVAVVDFFSVGTQRTIYQLCAGWAAVKMETLSLSAGSAAAGVTSGGDYNMQGDTNQYREMISVVLPFLVQRVLSGSHGFNDQKTLECAVEGLLRFVQSFAPLGEGSSNRSDNNSPNTVSPLSGTGESHVAPATVQQSQHWLIYVAQNEDLLKQILQSLGGQQSQQQQQPQFIVNVMKILSELVQNQISRAQSRSTLVKNGIVDLLAALLQQASVLERSTDEWQQLLMLCLHLLPQSGMDRQLGDFSQQFKTMRVNAKDYPRDFAVIPWRVETPQLNLSNVLSADSTMQDQEADFDFMTSYCDKIVPALIHLHDNSYPHVHWKVIIMRIFYRIISSASNEAVDMAPVHRQSVVLVSQILASVGMQSGKSSQRGSQEAVNFSLVQTQTALGRARQSEIRVSQPTIDLISSEDTTGSTSAPISTLSAADTSSVQAQPVANQSTTLSREQKNQVGSQLLALLAYTLLLIRQLSLTNNQYRSLLTRHGVLLELRRVCDWMTSQTEHVAAGSTYMSINEAVRSTAQELNDIIDQSTQSVTITASKTSQEAQSSDGEGAASLQSVLGLRAKQERWLKFSNTVRAYNDLLPLWILGQLNCEYQQFAGQFSSDQMTEQSSTIKDITGGLLNDNLTVCKVALQQFANLLKTHDMTFHEFQTSSMVQSLHNFLAKWDRQGLDLMAESFQDFTPLVKKLQEYLTLFDPFEIVSPFLGDPLQTSKYTSKKSAALLARPIRIKLVPDPDIKISAMKLMPAESLQTLGLTSFVVNVQSIASFQSLQEFLLPKFDAFCKKVHYLQTDAETSRRSSRRRPQSSDATTAQMTTTLSSETATSAPVRMHVDEHRMLDYDDVDDEEYDESGPLIQHASGQMQAERLRKDSSVVYDIDVENQSTSRPSSAEKQGKDKWQWSVQFSINGMAISQNMTVYGAVHRFESEQQHLQASNDVREDHSLNIFREMGRMFGVSASVVGGLQQQQQQKEAGKRVDVFQQVYTIKYKPVHVLIKNEPKDDKPQRRRSLRNQTSSDQDLKMIVSESTTLVAPHSFQKHTPLCNISFNDITQQLFANWLLETEGQFYSALTIMKQLHGSGFSPQSQFINQKLTAKLRRQFTDILMVASGLVPCWCREISANFGFLFPFEDRLNFLQNVAFGTGRSLMRWQQRQQHSADQSQENIGRISRQKIRVHRDRIFESALKVMESYAQNSRYIMEVEFFDEAGTGTGPTLEFFSLVSREFQKTCRHMWRSNSQNIMQDGGTAEFVHSLKGLFPIPLPVLKQSKCEEVLYCNLLQNFKTLGRFVAKSMFDFRIIDIPFNIQFIERALFQDPLPKDARFGCLSGSSHDAKILHHLANELRNVELVDYELGKSLQYLLKFCQLKAQALQSNGNVVNIVVGGIHVVDLSLTMVLPGYDHVQLVTNGASINVTIENVEEYLARVVDAILYRGVERQLNAFRDGFNDVFAISSLRVLSPQEIQLLFCSGSWDGPWKRDEILDAIKVDHGLNRFSEQILWLVDLMCQFDQKQQQQYLQFVTGGSKLPIGGFKALTPPLTIVAKTCDNPDMYLPSVMTCVNYLKLPLYRSIEVLKKQMHYAMEEGQGSFHLS